MSKFKNFILFNILIFLIFAISLINIEKACNNIKRIPHNIKDFIGHT